MTEETLALEKAVSEFEQTTSVELVLVLKNRSGSYADIDLIWALLGAFFTVVVILWSPWLFRADWLPVNFLIGAAVGWLLSRFSPGLRSLLVSRSRRRRQVESAAGLAFLQQGVDGTMQRVGLLLYVSRWERMLHLCPDQTVRDCVPPTEWEKWRREFGEARNQEELLSLVPLLLEEMSAPLSRYLPPAATNPNELPDCAVVLD